MFSFKAFAQPHFLKTIATFSSFVFIAIVLVNPTNFGTFNKNEVNANFIANDYSVTNNGYTITPSLADLEETKSVIEKVNVIQTHIVRPTETLSQIAENYGVSEQNIKNTNNIVNEKSLKVWSNIYITSLFGVVYVPKETTSLMTFANINDIDLWSLKKLNNKKDLDPISPGTPILVPLSLSQAYQKWILLKPESIKPVILLSTKKANKSNQKVSINKSRSTIVRNTKKSGVVASRRQNLGTVAGMSAGQCTSYVAYKAEFLFPSFGEGRYRTIQGNAWQRLSSARSKWFKTSQKPTVWAVGVMSNGGGYNSAGHVVIVEAVDYENRRIKISDMNYLGPNIVTIRRINMNDEFIQANDGKQRFVGFIPSQPLPKKVQESYNSANW